jgi:DNA-binding beta-propeller fold protein YncE
VADVTSIDSCLFVLRDPSQQQIQVYDTKTFKQQRALQIENLSDYTSYSGLTSCETCNCIYVSDCNKHTVYKIELYGDNKVFSWCVGSWPMGLSITSSCHLLVACAHEIQEYKTDGSFVREICLKLNDDVFYPIHAIQLTSDQFVVSCWNVTNKVNDVVEADATGQVVSSYTNQLQSTTQHKFNEPCRLSVDRNNECILVADRNNNRIMILSRTLNCHARKLNVLSVDSGLQQPSIVFISTNLKIDYLSANSAVSAVSWCLTTSCNIDYSFQ